MPVLQDSPRHKGIPLPPSGWVLAVLLVVYIFTGLIGHDPWKHDDAITIGVVYDVFSHGNWLLPHLAGQPYPDAPLYYWTAATTTHLFSWLLPVHDTVRLASGIYTLLALEFILLAARELHGKEHAAAAPLILAGSIGFLFHAHEAQPMLAALTALTAAYWALALMPRRPRLATTTLGLAAGLGFLANGLLPFVALLPSTLASIIFAENRKAMTAHVILAAAIAALIAASWLTPLYMTSPQSFSVFLGHELASLTKDVPTLSNTLRYLNLLLWYAWPALPLAAWVLWAKRRVLLTRPLAVPFFSFISLLLFQGFCIEQNSSVVLLLLPPLVLLSVPGVGSLRRGAANAFDWFGMMTFTFLAAVAWIAWSAMTFGWPARLARQAARLEPGFSGHFGLLAFLFAATATTVWLWMIATSPRSPMRGIMHWMAGLTLFWLLIASLWMPWIDYGKSYRALAASLAASLPKKTDCIASANLPDSILASLDYFEGIRTVPLKSDASKKCSWLLLQGEPRDPQAIAAVGWRQAWEGKRHGDRHEGDFFHLYRRGTKARRADGLSEIEVEDPELLKLPR